MSQQDILRALARFRTDLLRKPARLHDLDFKMNDQGGPLDLLTKRKPQARVELGAAFREDAGFRPGVFRAQVPVARQRRVRR